MSNLGVAGVATYWCSAWTNNVVQGNSVSSAPELVRILYDTGSKCGGPIVPAAFSGNQFIANVFRNPARGTSTLPAPAISIVMPGLVEGNLLQDNDMGTGGWTRCSQPIGRLHRRRRQCVRAGQNPVLSLELPLCPEDRRQRRVRPVRLVRQVPGTHWRISASFPRTFDERQRVPRTCRTSSYRSEPVDLHRFRMASSGFGS